MRDNESGMLSPYRVLDLTDEKGWLCAKLLGDLGADVIKIEPPGGDPGRNIGPFYHDEIDPQKSLYWFAYNASKRGITLDIESKDGQETFKKLVKSADFVIESFNPGYMDKIGLGYSALEKLNSGIIFVSITPFGQAGPYKDYKAPGIVAWAMSGHMYSCGDASRPPIQISYHPQAYLNGGAEGAVGAIMALHHRQLTGEGQQVDISVQHVLSQVSWSLFSRWDSEKVIKTRSVQLPNQGILWPCKDGYVVFFFHGSGMLATWYNPPFLKWMDKYGMAPDFMKEHDWESALPVTDEMLARMRQSVAQFFMAHPKTQLFREGDKFGRAPYPLSDIKDALESIQLADRKFWTEIRHPELNSVVTYPGAFAKCSEAPPRTSRRAPLIGEHNHEIREELESVKREPSINNSNKAQNLEKKLLEGIKVVEFSNWVAVPQMGKTLALYGAEVIKVEGKSHPDPQRQGGAIPGPDGRVSLDASFEFNQLHTSKRSIAINLSKPGGLELAKKLVVWADVLVENYSGEAMEKMGLGYNELKKVNPQIIMLGASMQGHTGPYASSRGVGQQLNALTGFYQITGWPDLKPFGPEEPYPDYFIPRFGLLTLMSALDYRRRTGRGMYIDISQYESALHFQSPLVLDYVVNGRVAIRAGNRYDYAAPHGAYRCSGADRWCAIAVSTDDEWQNFCKVVGNPAWTKDPRFSSLKARKKNEDELDKLVESWTINYPAEEVMTLMQTSGVGAGVVQNSQDVIDKDPQLKHRHLFWELDHSVIGKYHGAGPPFLLSKSPYEVRRAPLLGEHNEYVCKNIIGLSDNEIAELVIDGAIE